MGGTKLPRRALQRLALIAICTGFLIWGGSKDLHRHQPGASKPALDDWPAAGPAGRALLQSSPSSSMLSQPFIFTWRTSLMLVVAFVFSALAMPAGVGGGILLTPLINILLQFTPRDAVAQSAAFIFGGALGSAWVNLARCHPEDGREPLIDFDMLLLLAPLMLAGVALGVILNSILPNWLVVFMLLVAMVWQIQLMLRKGLALRRQERQARAAALAKQPSEGAAGADAGAPAAVAQRPPWLPRAWAAVREELIQHPRLDGRALIRLAAAALIWTGFVTFQAVRAALSGSRGTRCFTAFYVLLSVQMALLVLAAAIYTAHLKRARALRDRAQRGLQLAAVGGTGARAAAAGAPAATATNGRAAENGVLSKNPEAGAAAPAAAATAAPSAGGQAAGAGDFPEHPAAGPPAAAATATVPATVSGQKVTPDSKGWSLQKVLLVQAVTLVGSTLATVIGLGGGIVAVPVLLELGVHPLASSATAAFIALLTMSSATISYGVQSRLNLDYCLIYGAACFMGSLVGVAVVNRVVRKSGAKSLVVLLLAGVVAGGLVLCCAITIPNAIEDLKSSTNTGFTSFCG